MIDEVNDTRRTGNSECDRRVQGLVEAHEDAVLTRARMAAATRAYGHLRETEDA